MLAIPKPRSLEISEEVFFWYGSGFLQQAEEELGSPLRTERDFLAEYRSSLPPEDQALLGRGQGILQIETAAERLYELPVVRGFAGNGRLVPFTRLENRRPGYWDLRASELTANCALEVCLRRAGRAGVSEEARKRMKEGTFGHHISLQDLPSGIPPPLLCPWNSPAPRKPTANVLSPLSWTG